MLLAGSASALRQAGGGGQASLPAGQGIPLQPLDDCFAQLARTFELASGETTVRRAAQGCGGACRLLSTCFGLRWDCAAACERPAQGLWGVCRPTAHALRCGGKPTLQASGIGLGISACAACEL